jgi:HAE1 family hydrophobic/amphiphilic exporter-1
LMYMILAADFESFVHPFTVLLSVPLGVFGAFVALWITGAGLNTVSLIGIVVLVGIVDNDAVVKVDFINQMRRSGLSVRDSIREAGHHRLRPIVINTITALVGVLPMALGIGPGASLQAPLAIAILGGLTTSTALTLIVIPVVYDLLDEGGQKLRALFGFAKARDVQTQPSVAPHPVPSAGD